MQTIYGKQAWQTSSPQRSGLAGFCATNGSARDTGLPTLAGTRTPKSATNGRNKGDRSLVEALAQSAVYREYADAFTEATGLPVALRPVESWQLPLHGQRHEAPYCALVAQRSRACAACLRMHEKLSQRRGVGASHRSVCGGIVRDGGARSLGRSFAWILADRPGVPQRATQNQFKRTATMLAEKGVEVAPGTLKDAYFATRVMPQKQQDSATTLLRIFAQHLSMLCNQVIVQQENAEPPAITKAKAYIQEHLCENLRLGEVAKAANTSTFYFCKMFKKATGINFTDHLGRVRIEKAKNLLLNPNLRVSEIAFEV